MQCFKFERNFFELHNLLANSKYVVYLHNQLLLRRTQKISYLTVTAKSNVWIGNNVTIKNNAYVTNSVIRNQCCMLYKGKKYYWNRKCCNKKCRD